MFDIVQEIVNTVLYLFGALTLITFATLFVVSVYTEMTGKNDPTLIVNRQFDKIKRP